MALLMIEGFEGFGSSTGSAPSPAGIIGRKWGNVIGESGFDIETGRGGTGYCIEFNSGTHQMQSPAGLTTDPTMVVGFAFSADEASESGVFLNFKDGASFGMGLYLESNGTIRAQRGGVTTLGTTVKSITRSTWYYIEFKVLCSDTVGTVDVIVNGENWLSLTGQDTKGGANTYHDSFYLEGSASQPTRFDDLYCLDGTGSKNNDALGNRKVVALSPDGAGDDTDWTPSAGSNYQNVDEGALLDEDTTYNETSTDADQDLFTYDNLPSTVAAIDGIQINSEARVTSGSMDLRSVIKTGTTTDTGSPTVVTSTSYITATRIEEDDPDTAVAFTPSGLDAAQFGVLANT